MPNGSPVTNAMVEIWQTNAWGRYQDRRDRSDAPWDPNFQGYGCPSRCCSSRVCPSRLGLRLRKAPFHFHVRCLLV